MTEERKTVHKCVYDLGVAAYILMHGYKVVGKKDRSIFFEIPEDDTQFEKYIIEYQPPNDFYIFDSCLMYLKKIGEYLPPNYKDLNLITVSDLGTAAYLMLHEHKTIPLGTKVIGKKDKQIYFEVPKNKTKEFSQLAFEYLPSAFHTYDSCLMSLKKIQNICSFQIK